jgi:hypothetical protein
MTASARFLTPAALLLLAGCAATPAAVQEDPSPLPFVTSSGLVVGTLSYQFVEAGAQPAWTVHFERIDAPAQQDYSLPVEVDPQSRSGVFTGTLPAGVYAFRAAASANRNFNAGALRMPLGVRAGGGRDPAHYAVDPVTRQ